MTELTAVPAERMRTPETALKEIAVRPTLGHEPIAWSMAGSALNAATVDAAAGAVGR